MAAGECVPAVYSLHMEGRHCCCSGYNSRGVCSSARAFQPDNIWLRSTRTPDWSGNFMTYRIALLGSRQVQPDPVSGRAGKV